MKRLLPFSLLLIIIAVVYRAWLGTSFLLGGDLGMTFHSMYFNDFLYPFAWYWNQGNGLGGNATSLLLIYWDYALTKTVFGQVLGLSWNITERLAYFFPFLILGLSSCLVLAKGVFPKNPFLSLSALIFLINSYILMAVGGGQLWIFLSYAIAPLVLYSFLNLINQVEVGKRLSLSKSILAGLVLSLQVMIDLRIAYVTLVAVGMYWLIKTCLDKKPRTALKSLVLVFLVPGIVTFLIHAFWIVPTMINGQYLDQFGAAYTSADAVKFFSFAKFENSLALLHPYWPENIFGKVGFMKPEFLILPVLAFSSLFFIPKIKDQKTKTYVLFFALLGLIGTFLAKGANEPFGDIYIWMFEHFPGFALFRDSTKWYTLVALSYSMLIPFSVWKIYELLKVQSRVFVKNKIFNLHNLFVVFIVLCLLFLIRPALLGKLRGTFQPTQIPREYINLENYLSSQRTFFRTFWVPRHQRFGLNSAIHPGVTAENFYDTYNLPSLLSKLRDENSRTSLQEASIKYVIVPYDSEIEIFLKDRKYDEIAYLKTLKEAEEISWLKPVSGFGKIAVFEVPNPKDHFWSPNLKTEVNYTYINPTKYLVTLQNAKKGELLVFSEGFDKNWIAKGEGGTVSADKFDKRFNSFRLKKDGSYSLEIYFSSQKWVDLGIVISVGSILIVILALFYLKRR